MRLLRLVLALSVVTLLLAPVAAQNFDADLQRAIQKEATTGNLTAAIAEYKQIAERAATSNRGVAAKALLRQAETHEKLGDAPAARGIYARIGAEFSDQSSVVAIAQRRIAQPAINAARPATSQHPVERTLWSGADLPKGYIAAVSPDGRSVAYVRDVETGDGALVLRDIGTGRDRPLTSAPGPITRDRAQYAVYAAFSRDGRRLAYDWRIQEPQPGANRLTIIDELRVIDLTEPGVPTPQVLFRDEHTQGYSVRPIDWFPDGQRIVVLIGHGDERTRQLGIVSVRDKSFRSLHTLDWRNALGVALSPDGRYLAFDLPADERTGQRDIYILATDGSSKVTAVAGPERDVVIGWSPDGTRLIFKRDELQLWAQPMAEGRPQGPSSIVKADARGTNFRVTAGGDLFGEVDSDDRSFYRAPVDFATGRSLGPARAVHSVLAAPFVTDWSPDGKLMASMHSIAGDMVLAVRSYDSGETRVLSVPLSFFDNTNFQWMPDGRALLARAADMNGRLGFYRVDVADGTVTPFHLPAPGENFTRPQLSKDGSTLYYIKAAGVPGAGGLPNGGGRFFVERDLASGRERVIVTLDRPNVTYGAVSPDGKYIGAVGWSRMDGNRPASDAAWIFSVISTADGTEREIHRVNPPAEFLGGPPVEWTRDGRFLVARKVVGQNREVWSIPVGGGEARRLDLGVASYTGRQVRLSPDGREIVVQSGSPVRREVRIVERFLPPAQR